MIEQIYILGIVIITLIVVLYYYNQESKYKRELQRIASLEDQMKQEEAKINSLKSLSQPCSIPNLNDPRSCFVNSNYTCTWNTAINRCDAS